MVATSLVGNLITNSFHMWRAIRVHVRQNTDVISWYVIALLSWYSLVLVCPHYQCWPMREGEDYITVMNNQWTVVFLNQATDEYEQVPTQKCYNISANSSHEKRAPSLGGAVRGATRKTSSWSSSRMACHMAISPWGLTTKAASEASESDPFH